METPIASERIAGVCEKCGMGIIIYGKGCAPKKNLCTDCFWKYIPDEGDGSFAPIGECGYCDQHREMETRFMPSHYASSRCRSGGNNHCTCDTCF